MKIRLFKNNSFVFYYWKFFFRKKTFLINFDKNNKDNINCDFITIKDRFKLEKKSILIADKIIKYKKSSIYSKYLSFSLKKRTALEINKILLYDHISEYLIKKDLFKKNIDNIIFYDHTLSSSFFFKFKNYYKVKFKLSISSHIKSNIIDFFKFLKLVYYIFFSSQFQLLFFLKKKKKIIKKKFFSPFYFLDESQKNYFSSSLNPLKINNKLNFIFNNKNNLDDKIIKKSIFLEDLKNKISFNSYFNKIYLKKNNLIMSMSKILFKNYHCSSTILNNLIEFEKWSLFSLLYKPKVILSCMISNDPFYYFVNNHNNSKLYFLYFSYHSGLKIMPTKKNLLLDYSFMHYDRLISFPNDLVLFKNSTNEINSFYPFNMFKLYLKKNFKPLKKKIKKIIFFDCNYGCKKAQNYVSYNTFLESIIEISKNINAKIFLKSKLSYDQNHNQGDIKIKKNLEIIRATKNIEYLDITANTEQIINNSDLIVSLFLTTSFYEAIHLGIPSIYFDPSKNYNYFFNKMPKINNLTIFDKKVLVESVMFLKSKKRRILLINEASRYLYNNTRKNCEINKNKILN